MYDDPVSMRDEFENEDDLHDAKGGGGRFCFVRYNEGMKRSATPTRAQFEAYEKMFVYFNERLFSGGLPACLLNFSRRTKTNGFFAPSRWERGKDVRHEISLNPSTLKSRKPIEVASTLVHEMVHLWQQEHGKPSRSGYHNAEWAEKMEIVGLVPSDTGVEGGAKTGQRVTHYIAAGGPFAIAFRAMPKEYTLPWACEEPEGVRAKKATKNRIKYTCPGCGANVWGKPELAISCDECAEIFERSGGTLPHWNLADYEEARAFRAAFARFNRHLKDKAEEGDGR